MNNPKDELREHNFDGIQEYDNDLPRWWVWLFIITVVVSAVYPFLYDMQGNSFASQTIDKEMAEYNASRSAALPAADAKAGGETDLIALASNAEGLKQGSQIYVAKCLVCHGDKGQGLIGPNLTDDYWIHGGKIADIRNTVLNGVLDKGMLAWKDQLKPDEINAVVAFVWSIRGSNPPNPKAPEGNKVG